MTGSLVMGNHRPEFWRGRTVAVGACPPKRKQYSPDAKAAVARAMIVIKQLMFGLMPERRRGERRISETNLSSVGR